VQRASTPLVRTVGSLFDVLQQARDAAPQDHELIVLRDRAYDVLEVSAVGAPFVGYKRAAFLDPDGTPVAFALDLALKDLRLIEDLARDVLVPMPQAWTDLEVIETATRDGGGDRDFSAVADHLRRLGGSGEDATA
jgi:3-hydroxyisobutyrate dehydrogenase-like beta-hydroxyacid dehydrogenase